MFVILTILLFFLFFNDTATTEIYTLSLHDALPISPPTLPALRATSGTTRRSRQRWRAPEEKHRARTECLERSEEHTSELQSLRHLVCRLLLEKKKKIKRKTQNTKRDLTHHKLSCER